MECAAYPSVEGFSSPRLSPAAGISYGEVSREQMPGGDSSYCMPAHKHDGLLSIIINSSLGLLTGS